MGTAGQGVEQKTDEEEVLKQFMELLGNQGMEGQMKELMEFFRYAVGAQRQFGEILDELQGVRQELSRMQEKQPEPEAGGFMDNVERFQKNLTALSERLSAVKDSFMETAAQSVRAFKEKGKAGMCKVLQKGISGIKKMLADYRKCLVDIMADYQKTADRIDGVGNELKQIGNSVSNVGRLIAGKAVKEASDEMPGVSLTRALNHPVKRTVEKLQKNIDMADKALERLDRLSDSLQAGKGTEKSGRASVKDKLRRMKAEAGGKDAPEPDRAKAKGKEECL